MQPYKYNAHELSVESGLSYPVVQRRLSRITPIGVDGRSNLYLMADAAPLLFGSGDAEILTFEVARNRRMTAEAKLAEFELAARQRSMMRVEEVEARLNRTFIAIEARLSAFPSKAAPLIAPDDTARVRAILDGLIREITVELQTSDIGDEVGDTGNGTGSGKAA